MEGIKTILYLQLLNSSTFQLSLHAGMERKVGVPGFEPGTNQL